ncbi:aminotransferase class III-fold pyridoxal phosphate-dependent enzyme [Mesorhizobium sp. Cs1299R1N1]|uniref:aspartate aminotransferase family protein n=1 Tax=Mesorhizobium sp. Cs1299R1N1 TaxID=3015172 RepID=UPI00301DD2C4
MEWLVAEKATDIDVELGALESRYAKQNAISKAKRLAASRFLPGGNSRAVLHYDPFPIYIAGAAGSRVTDVDGNSYVDFTNDMTAGFYGHSNPLILAAIARALDGGISFGGPHEMEIALGEAICNRIGSIERVRFCNSGTEANLVAMRLARAVAARPLVLAFHGGYHGSMATYLNVDAPLNVDTSTMRFAKYNDEADVRRIFGECGTEIAAVIVEPMMASGGGILAEPAFLKFLRRFTTENGALLIFDEVVTSRLSPGGFQEIVEIAPDLTTLGKSIGGGLTFGAFGGRAGVVDRLDPTQPGAILHSGTFNNNVLTMTAGYVGLTKVATPAALQEVNDRADRLRETLLDISYRNGRALTLGGYGSIISLHFQSEVPLNPDAIKTSATQRKLFHLDMLLRGFYSPRRGTINLSLATTNDDCDVFARGFAAFLERYGGFFPAH